MPPRAPLRLVGDVHGYIGSYADRVADAIFSLQVGDMGFDYRLLAALDPVAHRVLGGNHDDYTRGPCDCGGDEDGGCPACGGRGFRFVRQTAHFLPDFGPVVLGGRAVFVARGAWSIDHEYRTPGLNWWPDEEMTPDRLDRAVSTYAAAKPDLVVSHTAPASVVPQIPFRRLFGSEIRATRTDFALERMLRLHRPELWVFGHFHHSWDAVIDGTRFVCLDELECLDLPGDAP